MTTLFWPRAVLVCTLPLWARHVAAQTFTPAVSTPFSYPGSTFILTLAFADAAPTLNAAGFQWTLSIPSGMNVGTPVAGAASVAANKQIQCNGLTCIAFGVDASIYQSGIVATIPIFITPAAPKGNQPITITSVVASSQGNQIPVPSPATVFLNIRPNTGTTPWFTATVGSNTCQGFKVAQTPIKVSWTCADLYGASSGSYIADMTNAGGGTSYFYVGVNSIAGLPPVPSSNISCLIQVNATGAAANMLNGVAVPGNSAAYSCQGYTTTGQGVISWP